jgi:predicted nucleotide-binding protein (sugar kinase/HSP70/actin superfamily)
MKIGIPNSLLFVRYRVFIETLLSELGAEITVSPETNRSILDQGVKFCVDEACLPVKVFHGHVSWLKDKCDLIFVPRIMQVEEKKYICPMFCGLPDMIKSSIPNIGGYLLSPVFTAGRNALLSWAFKAAAPIGSDIKEVKRALKTAIKKQEDSNSIYRDNTFQLNIALIGHMYHIYDKFINMNLIDKLNKLGIGVIQYDSVKRNEINKEVGSLFKQPFWYFAAQYYGSAVHLYKSGCVDGLIYTSAFSCGVDSVVTELIRYAVSGFPFLILKLDEHTGEAGFNTRLEAFADMLKRRKINGNNRSKNGEYMPCGEGTV